MSEDSPAYDEGHVINLFPRVVVANDDGALSDQGGFILTHQEFDEVVRKATAFYSRYSPGAIEEYNQKVNDRWESKNEYFMSFTKKDISDQRNRESGNLYILESGGLYKVGITKNLPNRIKSLQRQSASPVTLVYSIQCEGYKLLERDIHDQWCYARKHGEWFEFNPTMLASVVKYADRWDLDQYLEDRDGVQSA